MVNKRGRRLQSEPCLYATFYFMYLWFLYLFVAEIPSLNISYKPQKISPKSQGTVQQLLHERIRDAYILPQVNTYSSLRNQNFVSFIFIFYLHVLNILL